MQIPAGNMMVDLFETQERTADAPLIVLLGESEEGFAALFKQVQQKKLNCVLCRVPVSDWNGQLSPWAGKAVFRGGEDFSGGAAEFLQELLPAISELKRVTSCERVRLAGYSLAGLFVLYAAVQTDALDAVAAMSPSVWYEGWMEYMQAHPVKNADMKAYLSLGKAEEKARNPVLRRVGECVRAAQVLLQEQLGKEVPLVMHDGGHHYEVPARILAGVEWLAEN